MIKTCSKRCYLVLLARIKEAVIYFDVFLKDLFVIWGDHQLKEARIVVHCILLCDEVIILAKLKESLVEQLEVCGDEIVVHTLYDKDKLPKDLREELQTLVFFKP